MPASPAFAGFFTDFLENFKKPIEPVRAYNSQTIPLLQAAINTNPDANIGGAELVVDNGALVSQDSPAGGLAENLKDRPSSDQISIYVVHRGDSLVSIAKMFNVTVNTLRWANDLSGTTLSEGQTLTILPISGVRHVVKKGDTVKSIAKLYKADIEEVLAYNYISADTKLNVGDVVIVPDGEMSSSGSSNTVKFVESSNPVVSGYYMRPVPGRKTQGLHGHNGVDLGSPVGTPIVAAAPGTVIISRVGGWNGGYGNYVVIQHDNGTQTLYSHNSSNTVSVGDHVNRGQVIGYIGLTGKTTGPHVHFEVRGARNPFQ
ncbi:MAG: peptidoglycan DD-metalloendopeptidase family protein [Minisyncoccia bacterium]